MARWVCCDQGHNFDLIIVVLSHDAIVTAAPRRVAEPFVCESATAELGRLYLTLLFHWRCSVILLLSRTSLSFRFVQSALKFVDRLDLFRLRSLPYSIKSVETLARKKGDTSG